MHHPPFHLYGTDRFLVLAREVVAEPNLVSRDIVLVRAGQTADILFDATCPGVWMSQCHIAEHTQKRHDAQLQRRPRSGRRQLTTRAR